MRHRAVRGGTSLSLVVLTAAPFLRWHAHRRAVHGYTSQKSIVHVSPSSLWRYIHCLALHGCTLIRFIFFETVDASSRCVQLYVTKVYRHLSGFVPHDHGKCLLLSPCPSIWMPRAAKITSDEVSKDMVLMFSSAAFRHISVPTRFIHVLLAFSLMGNDLTKCVILRVSFIVDGQLTHCLFFFVAFYGSANLCDRFQSLLWSWYPSYFDGQDHAVKLYDADCNSEDLHLDDWKRPPFLGVSLLEESLIAVLVAVL